MSNVLCSDMLFSQHKLKSVGGKFRLQMVEGGAASSPRGHSLGRLPDQHLLWDSLLTIAMSCNVGIIPELRVLLALFPTLEIEAQRGKSYVWGEFSDK